jgi:hypothetical protein
LPISAIDSALKRSKLAIPFLSTVDFYEGAEWGIWLNRVKIKDIIPQSFTPS